MTYLRPNIAAMKGYAPGFQPDDVASWIKLNTNENPYPPSPKVVVAIIAEIGSNGASLRTYPSASSMKLREAAGELYGFDPSWIIMANGSDEVLNNLIRACAGEGQEVGYVHPSYSYYSTLAEIQGAAVRTYGLTDSFAIEAFPEYYHGKVFFLTTMTVLLSQLPIGSKQIILRVLAIGREKGAPIQERQEVGSDEFPQRDQACSN